MFLINYHLIWCPKRRKKVLVGDIKIRLEQIMNEVAKEKNIEILALEIMPDHLHLFVSTAGNVSSDTIKKYIQEQNTQ